MKKPSAKAIAAAMPLTARRPVEPIGVCNVCGQPSADLGLWVEHDTRDKPIKGTGAYVYIARDHDACYKAMADHPRLYVEIMGGPGHFAMCCGPCSNRDGWSCRHPDLKANGGPGLLVHLRWSVPYGAIVCPPPPGPRARAESCKGFAPRSDGTPG